ncbi:FadR/GntR family transcriptional regulator [Allosediminivita pacifica]|uniref:GntR family transcriptional regulator n=1 Tax=Allosediminivita pacifica TaxID=1267769 RepID=A0A2T5ZWG9_9RHOB|nr:FadR/GntR family transcriptional regulator [Allosediminivita pacifica]PTX35868.1 GntR family transcriptional regulator [Allosediminivita pacifica]GGB31023.1 transcriptional regulator [Allosediminivita pacifica]
MDNFNTKPAQKPKLAEIVYGRILEQIMAKQFGEGDKLPSESELSSAFGVSRPVTREALMRLQADGLVTTHKGVGTFVARRPPERLGELADTSEVSGYLLSLEPRIVLEVEAARLAAQRRTRQQMAAIRAAHDALRDAIGRGELGRNEDIDFHDSIAIAAGNENFRMLLRTISNPVHQTITIGLELGRDQRRRVVDEHASIVEALNAEDSEAAATYMRYHLFQARAGLVDIHHHMSPEGAETD